MSMVEISKEELSAQRALYRLIADASKFWHVGCGFWLSDAERAKRIEGLTETECVSCRAVRLYKAGDARKQVEFVRSVFAGELGKADSDEGRDLAIVLGWFDGPGRKQGEEAR